MTILKIKGESVDFDGQINHKIYEVLTLSPNRSEHKICFGAS
jgi:hypothetical protein